MAVQTTELEKKPSFDGPVETAERPFGPAAAVMIAAGIGSFVLGLLTTLAEANADMKGFLQFSDAVGPLAGKTIIAGAVFLGSWGLLTAVWRRSNPPLRPVVVATTVLVVIGLVMTFPIFFQAFAPEE